MLFTGSSHPELAKEIAKALGWKLGKMNIETFPDGEIGIQIHEDVRGKDIFLVQSPARHPNRYLVELLLMIDTVKRADAKSINVVMPYFPYARQDRREGQTPIAAKLVANSLEEAGMSRLITMDLHNAPIEGFFTVPVDHLHARSLLIKALKKKTNTVVVAPDTGAFLMAKKFAEELNVKAAFVDKHRSSGTAVKANDVLGNVKGKDVILVDDIISTGGTLKEAARICKKEGANSCIAVATHCLFEGHIKEIDQLIVTDTIPQKKKSVSTASIFAKSILAIHNQ